MKKAFYILIAIITFIIGTTASYFRPLVIPVSLYEIKRNSKFLDGREVHIRGLLSYNDGIVTISDIENECSITAFVGNPEELINDADIVKLYDELDSLKSKEGFYFAEVEVMARVYDPWLSKTQYCFKPQLNLEVKSALQISSIRFISKEKFQK